MPPNTFGHQWAKFLKTYNLNQIYFSPLEYSKIDDVYNYIKKRTRETHDIHHVVLGISPDPSGEIEVLAFLAAQYRFPETGIMLGLAFLFMIFKSPEKFEILVESIISGWQQGKNSKKFYGVKWEEFLEKDIAEVRNFVSVTTSQVNPIL